MNPTQKKRERKKAEKKHGRPMEYINGVLVFSDTKMNKKEEIKHSIELPPWEYQCSKCGSFNIDPYKNWVTNICKDCGRITQF